MDATPERTPAARDLPSPPVLLARVIRLATDPSVGGPKLAAVIATDPVFATEVVRAANSSFYGAQTQVTSVQRAVVLLGGRSVRSLAICFAARDVMRQCGLGAEDVASFWEDMLRRAVAARRLARRTHLADPEEAFATALLSEFGMIALLRAFRWHIPEWGGLRRELPAARLDREVALFGAHHALVAADILTRWGLPAGLVSAIAHHHTTGDAALPRDQAGLSAILGLADRVSAVFTAAEPHRARTEAAQAAQGHGISPDEVDAILEAIPRGVEEAALALGLRVRPQPSRAEALAAPVRELEALHLSYEELTVRLEAALKERDGLLEETIRLQARVEELVWYDPLTGLITRRRFEDCLRRELARLRDGGGPVSVVLLEVDGFRRVVDEHGVVFTDTMLRFVAQVLQNSTRSADPKGRVDDAVFGILLPGALEGPARVLAERLRTQIAALSLRSGGRSVFASASVGGVTSMQMPPGVDEGAWVQGLLDRADRAVLNAREGGGNRVVWGE